MRQVKRLLRQIYRSHHFYFIHVDERYNWMYSKLVTLEKIPNIKVVRQRFKTFWASNTILYFLLSAFKEILELGWNFDYVMNISESDFPVKPLEEFEDHLKANIGRNFVETGAGIDGDLISGHELQGLNNLFYNCEDHMYLLGKRNLPFGLQWVVGSDWVVLHREFVHYLATSDDGLVRGLISFYFYSVIAPESFFPTALFNSRFC